LSLPRTTKEQNIGDCLKSVLGQTIERCRYEVIVVDDRSTDRTGEIARSFLHECPNLSIITITQTPSGISAKKTRGGAGIALARNEIIVFTDADCRVPRPGWKRYANASDGRRHGRQGITNYVYVQGMNKCFLTCKP